MMQAGREETFSAVAESTEFRREQDEKQLLKRLRATSEQDRAEALEDSKALSQEARFSLIWKMLWQFPEEEIIARSQNRKLIRSGFIWTAVLTLLSIILSASQVLGMWSGNVAGLCLFSAGLLFLGVIICSTNNPHFQLNPVLSSLNRLLDENNDVRMAPVVLQFLRMHNPLLQSSKPLFQSLTSLLKRALPAISREEAMTWTVEQKEMAATLVKRYETTLDETLTLQAMRLLPFIGGRDALKVVRQMAGGNWIYTPVLRKKAFEILPALEERIADLELPNQLLRASSRPEEAGTHLLRPALSPPKEETEELLRVSGE